MSAHILVLKTVLVVKAEIDGSLLFYVCVCVLCKYDRDNRYISSDTLSLARHVIDVIDGLSDF